MADVRHRQALPRLKNSVYSANVRRARHRQNAKRRTSSFHITQERSTMHNDPSASFVRAALGALDLPADEATEKGVATHFSRLRAMAALVMEVPLTDEIETPSIFVP